MPTLAVRTYACLALATGSLRAGPEENGSYADCFRIPPAYVERRAAGYLVKLDGAPAFVPRRQASPSPDGDFWFCRRPGGPPNLFAPRRGA